MRGIRGGPEYQKKIDGLEIQIITNIANYEMREELETIKSSLAQALFSGSDFVTFNHVTLIGVFNILIKYLNDPANSSQSKFDFALKVFPVLMQIMTMPLWIARLSIVGNAGNLLIIYRQFHFYALNFQTLLNQAEYEEAIKKITSSNFPARLQDLPDFLKLHLLDELDRLVQLSESQRRERDRL
jgi:hypothetical protein